MGDLLRTYMEIKNGGQPERNPERPPVSSVTQEKLDRLLMHIEGMTRRLYEMEEAERMILLNQKALLGAIGYSDEDETSAVKWVTRNRCRDQYYEMQKFLSEH